MKNLVSAFTTALVLLGSAQIAAAATLTTIATFPDQITGITVSDDGRMFINIPRWRDGIPYSVAEVAADGTAHAYPDATWNQWSGQPAANQFTCVQSVIAHGSSLFVLDPSNPKMKGVLGKPTLYEFDLASNKLKSKWEFDTTVAPPRSYLNDLRVDDAAKRIYITDSGLGAIVVLDLASGKAKRFLDDDPSTKAEPIVLRPNGKPFVKANGQPQRLNSDGIALNGGYLYYHALTGYHLYRVPTSVLAITSKDANVVAKVEDLGTTPAPDGMIFDKKGHLFMADLEKNSVVYRAPDGKLTTLIQDPTLHWADTFTIDRNNNLVFTDSHLDQVTPGEPLKNTSFQIYSVPLP